MAGNKHEWERMQAPPALGAGEVHVWRVRLGPASDEDRRLLSPDEVERAERFAFTEHRRRFITRRALLRRLLAGYVDADPQALVFEYGEMGKPFLPPPYEQLQFNASSSLDVAVIGVALGTAVGVDVEYMRALSAMDNLAETAFSAEEIERYSVEPPEGRERLFYAGWTRKEAFIKAIGQGLAFPLRNLAVSMDPGEPARILRVDGITPGAEGWAMGEFSPASGYLGAVATPHIAATLRKMSHESW